MNDKKPLSVIVIPTVNLFSGIPCFFLSTQIYNSTFNVVSVINPEFNIIKIGIFQILYALTLILLYKKSKENYFSLLSLFATYEFISFIFSIYTFSVFQVSHILFTAIFHLGFFTLLIYERKLFIK